MAYAALHDQAIDLLTDAEHTRDRAAVDRAVWSLVMAKLGAADDSPLPGYLSHLGTDRFRLTAHPCCLGRYPMPALYPPREWPSLTVGDVVLDHTRAPAVVAAFAGEVVQPDLSPANC